MKEQQTKKETPRRPKREEKTRSNKNRQVRSSGRASFEVKWEWNSYGPFVEMRCEPLETVKRLMLRLNCASDIQSTARCNSQLSIFTPVHSVGIREGTGNQTELAVCMNLELIK